MSRNLLRLALCGVVAAAAAAPQDRWSAFVNYKCPDRWDPPCPDAVKDFDMEPQERTVLLPYHGSEHWPKLDDNGHPLTNGGVPQAGSLHTHLQGVRKIVNESILDPDYDGNVIVDFEFWTPSWDYCASSGDNWMSIHYQTYSKKLVQDAHPTWNDTEVTAEARKQFEGAGLKFFRETVLTIREMRPNVKVGFYGYPRYASYKVGKITAKDRAANNVLAPVWEVVTQYFPCVYLRAKPNKETDEEWHENLRTQVNATMTETFRILHKFNKRAVTPYYHSMYRRPALSPLQMRDMQMLMEETYKPPLSTGIVVWGSGHDEALPALLRDTEGPFFKANRAYANSCAEQHCSGNGWCASLNPDVPPTCVCDKGFTGAACDQTA
eukprot:TRINITY_DN32479_c0_g1_i1.p2 TRINITY_DN32479_c0_g1~~TRINITY_DN32479_c0_g1_i1.p2  ORF type:complete len:380 (+),score=134.76 TRINITY_DN32479_c0_g1_i1:58-1197(+)